MLSLLMFLHVWRVSHWRTLNASSLYSYRPGKGRRFQRSGAAAGKLAYPALHFVLRLLSCLGRASGVMLEYLGTCVISLAAVF